MEKREKVVYEKRSQKDYSMSFKLGVVKEIESGLISYYRMLKKSMVSKHDLRLSIG
jgi:hypothetical protein